MEAKDPSRTKGKTAPVLFARKKSNKSPRRSGGAANF